MRSRSLPIPLLIGLVIALVGGVRYCGQTQRNPVTGELQRVALSPKQEVALGLHSAPMMIARHGGELRDSQIAPYVESVGQRLVQKSLANKSPYRFQFHVLADKRTINAFALPGGQIFITQALLVKLRSEAQLAGVLGHEIGHVIARHGAQHLAKQQLGQLLVTAVQVGSYDSRDPHRNRNAALLAQAANQMISLRYGRQDELEADDYGFRIALDGGYDPHGIVELMQVLDEASAGGRVPEFLSTHPNPGNRRALLLERIQQTFPSPPGLPSHLRSGQPEFAAHVLAPALDPWPPQKRTQ
ncbi:MAG: M48 family metalloprotease [Myxococcales bacterium]|nr:M48 family metalloprotease [Myxococcales bacterium]